jgi:Uma2 family endonuclease
MSPSDTLKTVQTKMQEYLDNGLQLGWLLNRKDRQVEIYRPEQTVEILRSPISLSGEAILPGFSLDLACIIHEGYEKKHVLPRSEK